MQLLEQAYGVVHHVRALREVILGGADLVDGEYGLLCEMCKDWDGQMPVAVRDRPLREVVLAIVEGVEQRCVVDVER